MARDFPHIFVTPRKKPQRVEVPTRFGFKLTPQGRRTLVTPFPEAQWRDTPRYFRSLVYDKDGSVASVGLPKFHDHTHPLAPVAEVEEAWEDMVVSEKQDGRLLIRSVWQGVWWRTRGAMNADEYIDAVNRLVPDDSPLQDESWQPGASLQFELVSPGERVVIEHAEERLWLIGATDHRSLRQWSEAELREAAEAIGVPLSPRSPALEYASSLAALGEEVEGWENREGLVVSLDGTPLVRVKSRDYRLRHAFRVTYPPTMLAKLGERRLRGLLEGEDEELSSVVWAAWRLLQDNPDMLRWLKDISVEPWDTMARHIHNA